MREEGLPRFGLCRLWAPKQSDAAISHEPAPHVREVMGLPHPVIARSGPLCKHLREAVVYRISPHRLGAPGQSDAAIFTYGMTLTSRTWITGSCEIAASLLPGYTSKA